MIRTSQNALQWRRLCLARTSRRPDALKSGATAGETTMKRIYVVGTADTKGEELAFLAD